MHIARNGGSAGSSFYLSLYESWTLGGLWRGGGVEEMRQDIAGGGVRGGDRSGGDVDFLAAMGD